MTKVKRASTADSSESEGSEEHDKIAIRRAKNRDAARRMRERRLNTIKTLGEQVEVLTAENEKLKEELAALKGGEGPSSATSMSTTKGASSAKQSGKKVECRTAETQTDTNTAEAPPEWMAQQLMQLTALVGGINMRANTPPPPQMPPQLPPQLAQQLPPQLPPQLPSQLSPQMSPQVLDLSEDRRSPGGSAGSAGGSGFAGMATSQPMFGGMSMFGGTPDLLSLFAAQPMLATQIQQAGFLQQAALMQQVASNAAAVALANSRPQGQQQPHLEQQQQHQQQPRGQRQGEQAEPLRKQPHQVATQKRGNQREQAPGGPECMSAPPPPGVPEAMRSVGYGAPPALPAKQWQLPDDKPPEGQGASGPAGGHGGAAQRTQHMWTLADVVPRTLSDSQRTSEQAGTSAVGTSAGGGWGEPVAGQPRGPGGQSPGRSGPMVIMPMQEPSAGGPRIPAIDEDAVLMSTDLNIFSGAFSLPSDLVLASDMKLDSEELLRNVPLPHEAAASRSTDWL